jgi:hypothetical protein
MNDAQAASERTMLVRRARRWLGLFMAALVLSGLTAFPLEWETGLLASWFGSGTGAGDAFPGLAEWLARVHDGLRETNREFPFIAYGTDWLAFAHIVIAIAFIGPMMDPVKNVWVIDFGMIACVLVIPTALICGYFRGIPFGWRIIDCSFGALGLVPLYLARRNIRGIVEMDKPY